MELLYRFFLNGLVFDAESLFGVLYNTGFFSVESSYFLSRMKKMRDFPGWEKWKTQNLEGME